MVVVIEKETCPTCFKKTLTLSEEEIDIPFFGKTFAFSMSCSNCSFQKADVEATEKKDPCRVTFTVENEEDLKVRIVKSSEATVKIPQLRMDVTPGPSSEGYVSNIEGLLNRFEKIIQDERDTTEDEDIRKHAKNLLKKLWRVKTGDEKLKIVIEDHSGNSAIISEKAEIKKLK